MQRLVGALLPLVGALITVMSGLNSRLAAAVGTLIATLVIHAAGLAAVSLLLLVKHEEGRPGRIPFWYYMGGFVGVGTVFSTIYAFTMLGASLAVALALLGQTLCSVAIDAAGFLGRTKYPLTVKRLPGLGLAIIGVGVMAGSWHRDALAMLVAFVSGALPALSFSLNSELGRRKGLVRSTRVNYLVGLGTALAVALCVRPPVAAAAASLSAAGPLLALGGGVLGVVVISSMNFLFPRVPALSATLLLFCGQAFMGVLIDAVAAGALDVRKLAGTLIVLVGLAVNGLLAQARNPARLAGGPGTR